MNPFVPIVTNLMTHKEATYNAIEYEDQRDNSIANLRIPTSQVPSVEIEVFFIRGNCSGF